MIASIVGCGDSAKEWFKTPCDLSVGVNDCLKHGHQVDWLCIVNVPRKFKDQRWETIMASKPKRFICHDGRWKQWFPEAELTRLQRFRGSVKKGKILHSTTSPFVAINLAYNAGASDIILWGVDFLNHPVVKDKTLETELNEYRKLFEALEDKGVRCWLGSDGSVLSKYLKVYKPITSNSTAMNK